MKLLKNQQEFEEWKEIYVSYGDKFITPDYYPCYVVLEIKDWKYEHDEDFYILYRYDIEKMLMSFSSDTPCCGGGHQWGHSWDCPKCPE